MASNKLIGYIEPFIPGGNFCAYEDRLNQFFIINEVKDDKKTPLFLTIVGPDNYDVLMSLTVPDLPSTKTYEELIKQLRNFYAPRKNKRAERYKFHNAVQEEGETINEFIVKIKSLAQTCRFGDFLDTVGIQNADVVRSEQTTETPKSENQNICKYRLQILDDALVDRFIMGVRNSKIQQILLNEDISTFEECCTKALNIELSEKASKIIQPLSVNAVKPNKFNQQQHQQQIVHKRGRSQNNSHSKVNRNRNQSQSRPAQNSSTSSCRRCGRFHNGKPCPAVNWNCFVCQEKGHTSTMCYQRNINQVISKLEPNLNPAEITLVVENQPILFEIDTGACITIISEGEYLEHFHHVNLLTNYNSNLISVTGHCIKEIGKINTRVSFGSDVYELSITVVEANKPFKSLLGRSWLNVLFPNWRKNFENLNNGVLSVGSVSDNLQNILKTKFTRCLTSDLCTPIEGFEAELLLKDNVNPIFHAAYGVPFKLRDRVEKELNRLCQEKILIPIKYSRWASPIVVVPKSNGEIRICIDCKVTINPYVRTEHYPLPKIEEIFSQLANCKVFCVIDLKGAYQQLTITKSSQELLTINTFKGLFAYTRLPFGLTSAPSIFQSVMDRILLNMPHVFCYLDDILIGGLDEEDCKNNCLEVMSRLEKYNVRINIEKCKFLKSTVNYLGHTLTSKGLKPNEEKVQAIVECPAPSDVPQLQSYLGMINYYGKYIPNLSGELHCLYQLLEKGRTYCWSNECQNAFDRSKSLLLNHNLLEYYDPDKTIVVATDASPYGVGCVLSHLVNGIEKPVLFASSSLSPAEKNYSQLDREALAIVFALKKFKYYLYGQPFTVFTDNQALRDLLNPKKKTLPVASARLQRWIIFISSYNCNVKYRPARKMQNADALSRLPLNVPTDVDEFKINYFTSNNEIPVDMPTIKSETERDSILSQVYSHVISRWPKKIPEDLQSFYQKRNSLSTEDGVLYYMNRVVIPNVLRKSVMQGLHENHPGIVKSKMICRSYVWWPKIDNDIYEFIQSCLVCQQTQRSSTPASQSSWSSCTYPFERVHIDFFYFSGKTFLLLVDSYSKFCEVKLMPSTNLNSLINKLQEFFSNYGLPTEMVSDNGPPFQSFEYAKFCKNQGIKATWTPPYHPKSNGQVERYVQTVKSVFKKYCLVDVEGNLSINDKINKFLMYHRNTPSTVTGKTPAEMIFNFKPKITFDLINKKHKEQFDSQKIKSKKVTFNIETKNNQLEMKNKNKTVNSNKNNCNEKAKFKIGDNVLFLNNLKHFVKWIPAKIREVISRNTYLIIVNNHVRYVHADHLRPSWLKERYHPSLFINPIVNSDNLERNIKTPDRIKTNNELTNEQEISHKRKRSLSNTEESPEVILRRSKRIKNKPHKFSPSDYN